MHLSGKSPMLALGLLMSIVLPVLADSVIVKHVSGPDVEVDVRVEHVILGEGDKSISSPPSTRRTHSRTSSPGVSTCQKPIRNPMPPISRKIQRPPSLPPSAA